jgi:hypothetical protein
MDRSRKFKQKMYLKKSQAVQSRKLFPKIKTAIKSQQDNPPQKVQVALRVLKKKRSLANIKKSSCGYQPMKK